MTYLVTGGTGLVGRQVVRLLSQDGEKVVVYDVAPVRESLEQILDKEMSSSIEIVRGDVTDLALLIRTVQKYNVERIIHLAACTSTASEQNPLLAVQVNCIGTLNIFEIVRILSLKKVVWSSTGMIFGPPQKYDHEYISDDAPHYPPNIYAACKSFNEVATKHYFVKHGVDGIAIRFGKVYGAPWKGSSLSPMGGSTVITDELIVKPALGKPGRVPSGDATLNWLYVEDAARSVVMASRSATTKTKAFNVNGDIRPMTEAVAYVRKLIPNAQITVLPGLVDSVGRAVKYDATRAKEEIGYEPQWKMEDGIQKVIEEVRQQSDVQKP
jgi:UDP-glucose 4-epimerase